MDRMLTRWATFAARHEWGSKGHLAVNPFNTFHSIANINITYMILCIAAIGH